MFKKDIYKYRNEYGGITISPYKPDVEYEHMYRLIARSDDFLLTDFVIYTTCVDVTEKDVQLWHEVHKDDLETPISQNEEITNKIELLYKVGKVVASQVTDDIVAQELQDFYDDWENDISVSKGQYIKHDGILFKVLTEHKTQVGWEPDKAPSLFAKILTDPTGETILDWVQPDSTNAYMTGDKVRFEGLIYESLIDNNVWSPVGYPAGWKQVEE
jgi:hypothetical protein